MTTSTVLRGLGYISPPSPVTIRHELWHGVQLTLPQTPFGHVPIHFRKLIVTVTPDYSISLVGKS